MTGTIRSPADAYAAVEPISLNALDAVASLQVRVDRKYIVDPRVVTDLVSALPGSARVLEIDGRRSFGYQSVYFDTPGLAAYTAAAHQRRRRWKVRTRTYAETGECMLEVKTKGRRGATVKTRCSYSAQHARTLTPTAHRFVEDATAGACTSPDLFPALVTRYRRTTLVDVGAGCRLTVDHDLECSEGGRRLATIGDLLIVETKSTGRPSPSDRWLWAYGVRPTRVSKYCTGLAALHPELPANRWHRTLARDWTTASLGWSGAGTPGHAVGCGPH